MIKYYQTQFRKEVIILKKELYLFLKAIKTEDSSLIDNFEEETIETIKDAFHGFFYIGEVQKMVNNKYHLKREKLTEEGKKYIDYVEELAKQ